jgi:hypothetical protein
VHATVLKYTIFKISRWGHPWLLLTPYSLICSHVEFHPWRRSVLGIFVLNGSGCLYQHHKLIPLAINTYACFSCIEINRLGVLGLFGNEMFINEDWYLRYHLDELGRSKDESAMTQLII